MPAGLQSLIDASTAVVCLGSGGVGKTTTAAAIALQASLRGRSVACVTVDPARRLAQCFGFESFTGDAQQVELAQVAVREPMFPAPQPGARLDVLMLDSKAMFDALITRHAKEPERAERILANRIYQQVSTSLAGTREYMALEKLHELRASGLYDLVVVDTPPAANAEDLLSAPARLSGLIESPLMQWLGRAFSEEGKSRSGPVAAGARTVFAGFAKIASDSFLQEVAIFVGAMRSLLGGFVSRAQETIEVLHDDRVAKVLVARPDREVAQSSRVFAEWLRTQSLAPHLVVVNRVEHAPPPLLELVEVERELIDALPSLEKQDLQNVRALAQIALEERGRLVAAHEHQVAPLAALADIGPLATIPVLLDDEPLHRLATFGQALWAQ